MRWRRDFLSCLSGSKGYEMKELPLADFLSCLSGSKE